MLTKKYNLPSFTLIELLVVIAVLSILVAVVTVMGSLAYRSARSSTESTALRSILQAYTLHATDNNGALLAGYPDNQGDTVIGPDGGPITWPASSRYVWRLVPYLDDAMGSLYVNDQTELLELLQGSDCYEYIASLYPSFGLNAEWVGGDYRTPSSPLLDQFRWYARYLSDIKHPSRQLLFASARGPAGSESDEFNICLGGMNPNKLEGYYEIKSPYFPSSGSSWRWATDEGGSPTTALSTDSADQGYLSARHRGKVLSGQLDGSIELLTLEALADMRRWSTNADAPDWVPSITP